MTSIWESAAFLAGLPAKPAIKKNLSPEICRPYELKHHLISRNSDNLNKAVTGPKTAIKSWYSVWVVDIVHVKREFFLNCRPKWHLIDEKVRTGKIKDQSVGLWWGCGGEVISRIISRFFWRKLPTDDIASIYQFGWPWMWISYSSVMTSFQGMPRQFVLVSNWRPTRLKSQGICR